MTDEEHKEAVLQAVAKLSIAMKGTPVSIGVNGLVTLTAVMLCATSPDEDAALRRANTINEHLQDNIRKNYQNLRDQYVAYQRPQ